MELREEAGFHRREWRVQRAGRVGLIVFVVLAFLGLFGDGPLSQARIETAGGVLAYERVLRWQTTREITLSIATGGPFDVSVARDYAEALTLRAVQPFPLTVQDRGAERVFHFPPADGGVRLTFEVTPKRVGLLETDLTAPGVQARLRHWVMP